MTKIDLDMEYILGIYFSKEHEINILKSMSATKVYDTGKLESKISNIIAFGDSNKKTAAFKLMKILEMATTAFLKEVDGE